MRSAPDVRREGPAPGIVRVDPEDGMNGVFRDAPIALRASQPLDPGSLSAATLSVRDTEGPVPGRLRLSPDGHVVIWWAERLLRADTLHFVVASGLRDVRGRALLPHCSRFVPCGLAREDLQA